MLQNPTTVGKHGIDLITEFEGRHEDIGGGKYRAYRCPANVLTIFVGCTHGITEGMIVTEAQGRQMLAKELDENCREVNRMLKVPVTQAQFDALLSLSYNIGWPTLKKSTLLAKLNAGDIPGAAARFNDFRKAKVDGVLTTLPGLVRRRAAEASLFLSDTDEGHMPQAVDATPVQFTRGEMLKLGTGLALVAHPVIEGGKAAVDAAKPAADAMAGLKQVADDASMFQTVVKSLKGSLEFLLQNWEFSVVCAVLALAVSAIAQLRSSNS